MMMPETTGSQRCTKQATGIEVGPLHAEDVGQAIGVTSRGMRDIPLHVAAFGTDPAVRLRKLQRLLAIVLTTDRLTQHALVARDAGGVIVGVCAMAAPGACHAPAGEQLRTLPRLLALGPRPLWRVTTWMGAWARPDSKQRHWHLGPVAVDAHLQRQGIGSSMMREFAAKMDALGEVAYLETDMEINVTFYERFGFEVVGREDILGVPNWYMVRKPRLERSPSSQ
jgi:ribosomal protein S18 acetylase RimI-like enzyme